MNIKSHLPTVTIAISAFNESKNIHAFLESVLKQKEDIFKLEAIWIYNDGSIDDTVNVVKQFNSDKIFLFDDKKRLGKSTRLNQIYTTLQSDFLIQSDADTVWAHPLVASDMIRPFLQDKNVGMCGGHTQPLEATTFLEKAVNLTVEAYTPLRKMLKGGNNIFSVDGRLLSYRKELVKKIHIPENMTSNDKFTYFSCITLGYKYAYAPDAIVLYRSPQTLRDQLRQEGRFACSPFRHTRYFPKELVIQERAIPRSFQIKTTLKQFVKHPVMCSYISLINLYCRMQAKAYEKRITARWPMAVSTKKLA